MRYYIILLLLIILVSCTTNKTQEASNIQQQGLLKTTDNYNISYNFNKVNGTKSVILLHMLGKTKEDYNELATKLNKEGITTIAIDFRGHGKSSGDINNFTETDFNKMIMDANAAKIFLLQNNFNDINIIGASIGANIALNYATIDKDINKIILLSPGENYRGIKTLDILDKTNAKMLVIASEDDLTSYKTVEKINAQYKGEKEKITYTKGGHGINLLKTQPELNNEIIEFLKK